MKSCPRCGFIIDIQTDYCTRCGLRLVPDSEGKMDESEYLPGIVAAAKKMLEESSREKLPSESTEELTYPLVDRRKMPRANIGTRESKSYDTKQGSKFYYDYQDPQYVPSILATAPPPPPLDDEAGVPSAFLSKSTAKGTGRGTVRSAGKQPSEHLSPFKPPVEPVIEFATNSTFKPLSEPLKSRSVRSPFKQAKPVIEEKETDKKETKPEEKKEQIPIWLRNKMIDFHDD